MADASSGAPTFGEVSSAVASTAGGASDSSPTGDDAPSDVTDDMATTDAATTDAASTGAASTSTGEDTPSTASTRMTAVPLGTSEAPLGYWEYLPPGGASSPAPLLVFFHGASWMGDGSAAGLEALLDVGPPNLIAEDRWPDARPFVVLSPQYEGACSDPTDVDAFLRFAVATYHVDPDRIYLTGQSCGAMRSWAYLGESLDELVAAAVLISGNGVSAFESAGCELGRVAIWGLHNRDDPSVDEEGTVVPIEGLLGCAPPPDVQLTLYDDDPVHDAWTKTYDLSAGNDVFAWLLERTHR